MADNTRFFDINKAAYDQLVANWTTLPAILDNDDGEGLDLTAGYVQISMNSFSSDPASINGSTPKIRTSGTFTINILTPQNQSIGKGMSYASQIAQFFSGTNFSGVQMLMPAPSAAQSIKNPKGQFWLTPLICGFYYDTNITIL